MDVDWNTVELHPANLDFRKIKDIVNKAQKVFAIATNPFDVGFTFNQSLFRVRHKF